MAALVGVFVGGFIGTLVGGLLHELCFVEVAL
jgi:hypothetical protein